MYQYKAKIERVIDGDTVVALVDLGFGIHKRETFRLLGIDAQEMRTTEGVDAMIHLEKLLIHTYGVVRLDSHRDKQDKYGRYLAVLRTGDNVASINETMVEDGYATVYDGGKRK